MHELQAKPKDVLRPGGRANGAVHRAACPGEVEKALKRKAAVSENSLNTVLVEALSREAGVEREIVYHDLDSLAGTWEDDPAFDAALRAQHRIDKNLWK